jgi:hypothetical protein
MPRVFLGALMALVVSLPAAAKVQAFPPSFRTKAVQTDGAIIHLRIGAKGPQSLCCMASPILEICGRPWRRCSCRITRSSSPTYAAWGRPVFAVSVASASW